MNAFTKTWMLASLVTASSVFAQNPDKCRNNQKAPAPTPAPMTAAYNAPSRVEVRSTWDIYVQASFIYWLPDQDNMEYAISSSGSSLQGTSNNIEKLEPNFKPGFQIQGGMIFDYDNWDSYLQYTWFHNTNESSESAVAGGNLYPILGIPVDAGTSDGYSSAKGSWNLRMDFAEWVLSRSYYMSPKITCRPMCGIRGAWIRQKYDTQYVSNANTMNVANKSVSWGLGPEFGLTTNYTFAHGLRVFGDLGADLLFTRYSTSSVHETDSSTGYSYSIKESSINTIRPHAAVDLGFGWSSYFDNNNWHVDLMASYGFQVFWDQNMFRTFTDNVAFAHSFTPSGNLYIQGLNLSAKFDF